MVATRYAANDLTSQKKRKGFHAKYLAICKSKNISPLPEVKNKQRNIHMVDFHADRVRVYDWLAINGALESDKTLKILSIKLRKNDDIVFEDIDNLKKAKSLSSHPVIYSKFIIMEFLNALQSMLSINVQLEVMILEGMPIYGRYMTHLTKGLCSNRSLKIINFARTKMGDEACEILCANIKHLTNIESVNLSQCNLGPKGAESVRDYIRFQKIHRFSEAWIRSLRYQNVDTELFDGVKKIYLNNNPQIGDEGLEILTDELKEDVWVKEIEMQNCGLTSDGASHIMNCLQINKTILNFNVNNNSEIPDHLLRQIMIHLGSGDGESTDSGEGRSVQHKITKSQLIDNVKFLEDQLESETFRRKELEKLNGQLHNQISEVQKEMSINNSMVNIPEGYTLVANDELQKIMVKKSSTIVTHRSYLNAAVKLRRKKKSHAIKNVRSFINEPPQNSQQLSKSKSENVLKIDLAQRQKMFIERSIGDSLDIGGGSCEIEENSMMGIDLLRCFVKRKTTRHINHDDFDPRVYFKCKPSHVVPSNSDADTDE